jgi:hypothetical protein
VLLALFCSFLFSCSGEAFRSPTDPTEATTEAAVVGDAHGAARRRPAKITGAFLSGRVIDAADGSPVFAAIVRVQDQTVTAGSDGTFLVQRLTPGPATVSVERWGYQPATQNVTIVNGSNLLELRLTGKPVVVVTDISGAVYRLDYELSEFAVAGPLSPYTPLIPADFCRIDGSSVQYDKSQIARITGPGVVVTNTPCCPDGGEAVRVNVTLKSGESFDALMSECRYYRYDFIGRNRQTGRQEFFSFRQISEIRFP